MPRILATMEPDTSRAALDFVHGLLARPAAEQPALEGLLGELADAFGVSACGLSGLPDGQQHFRHGAASAAALPWFDDVSILDRAAGGTSALLIERAGRPRVLVAT